MDIAQKMEWVKILSHFQATIQSIVCLSLPLTLFPSYFHYIFAYFLIS